MRYTKKDYVLRCGDRFVAGGLFGEHILIDRNEFLLSFDTEEDAYIAKNTSRNEEVRNNARVYERNVLITYEACDQ
ncbi:hypothetical protein GuL6_083 [Buttiauxella phage vB_ButM_GuL6]|nr:hypothetical protein GuL6_083 [Buttiauxella phage vB_ButM_GuL6]